MPYVQRLDGAMIGLYESPQPGFAEEFLPEDDAEVIAFRARSEEQGGDPPEEPVPSP